ncbi:CBS domain-containing protein [Desulfocurvibacter africanus]|uniref:CBS domain-containing protein n=1 Tax=Desulfocurvibacter africanus TaxID=873 RepID=UPI00048909E1|nr:CBS domain-containing protein [Desulfocurvibacter africanus]
MYVGLKMLKGFQTVTTKTSVAEAQALLEKQHLWMLLVVDGEKLVGYVRDEDISAALPSMMTTLDKFEALYLLRKLTIGMIMRKDIVTVPPEMEIEAAANIMHEKNLAGLAVVDRSGKLVGYINRTVMLDVLVEEMGLRQGGARIVLEVEDRPGVLKDITGIIADQGISIISTSTFHQDRHLVVIRMATGDASAIEAVLRNRGFKLKTVEDFAGEWRS